MRGYGNGWSRDRSGLCISGKHRGYGYRMLHAKLGRKEGFKVNAHPNYFNESGGRGSDFTQRAPDPHRNADLRC